MIALIQGRHDASLPPRVFRPLPRLYIYSSRTYSTRTYSTRTYSTRTYFTRTYLQ
jgi:hypothetical protein